MDLKQQQLTLIRKMNELSAGQRIAMPKAVLRTISLEKLRNPSPLAQKPQNTNKPSNARNASDKSAQNKYEKILDRKLGISKQDQQNASKVGNGENRKMSKKFEEFKKEVEASEMKECTFKPALRAPTAPGPATRTVNNFFQEQLAFCQKKNDKIEEMRAILEANKVKENIFRPNAMLNRHHRPEEVQKVHERLYEDSKNKDKQSETSRQEHTAKNNSITKSQRFKGLSRGASSEKIARSEAAKHTEMPSNQLTEMPSQELYKISLHTHNDLSSVELSSVPSRKQSMELQSRQGSKGKECRRVDLNIYEKRESGKNEELCIQKVMREMATVLERCGLPLVFNYLEMNLFFEKMNFIPREASDHSRKALFEIWSMLQGEIFQEVSALSVMKIVLAILGCHNVEFVSKCISEGWLARTEELERRLKEQGKQLTLRQNLLMISERDSRTIRANFEELYLNRLKLGESDLIREEQPTSYAFKPLISRASTELAEKYRNRVLQESERLISENKLEFEVPEDGQIDHVDLLMLDEKRKDAVMQQKREERERERRKLEDESMITDRSSNRSPHRPNKDHKDRNQELYELGKAQPQRKDKSADEVAEERWRNELTFKPALKSRTNILAALHSKDNYIPDYEKAVYRMHEGRKLREGQSTDRQGDSSPLFYLNVAMEGSQSTKIAVYAQDNMRSITEKVRCMLELDPQGSTHKLERILKVQILPALKQMGIKLE